MTENADPPDPKPPGVTVRIKELPERAGCYMCEALLDGVSEEEFMVLSFPMPSGHGSVEPGFASPEAAEEDCRLRLNQLIGLLAASAISLGCAHGMAWDLENITFVRE